MVFVLNKEMNIQRVFVFFCIFNFWLVHEVPHPPTYQAFSPFQFSLKYQVTAEWSVLNSLGASCLFKMISLLFFSSDHYQLWMASPLTPPLQGSLQTFQVPLYCMFLSSS